MNCTPLPYLISGRGTWLQIAHSTYVDQFRFYHTASHYLRHELCYHIRLVEIALGRPRNLKIYSRRFTSTLRLLSMVTRTLYNLSILCPIIQYIHHCHSESNYSPIKSSRSPDIYKIDLCQVV